MSVWKRFLGWFGGQSDEPPSRQSGPRRVVLYDQMTLDYLSSSASDPNQEQLDELLVRVDHIRVIEGGMRNGQALGKEVLLDISGREHVEALADALRLDVNPERFGHMLSLGDPTIELLEGAQLLAVFGLHGRSIRWSVWKHDADLVDGERLVDWLAKRGVTGPREELDAARRAAELRAASREGWCAAMPTSLRALWPKRHDGFNLDPEIARALAVEHPDPVERAAALLDWYGANGGPWSGFPSYESVAELLLLELPLDALVGAVQGHDSATRREGAARLFAGWSFGHKRPEDLRQLPTELRASASPRNQC